jgi:peptidoglycan-associated lipoprotein
MKKSLYPLAVFVLVFAGIAVTGTGCGKKTSPQPPAATAPTPTATEITPNAPAPTITLTASPSAINKGQTATIMWRTSNATEVTIDGGVGTVEASGSRTVSPASSVTFRARAAGPGGSATAEARITVSEGDVIPPPSRTITDAEWFPSSIKDAFFEYDSYDIRDEARQALMEDARALNQNDRKHIRITIEGHCDERGSEAYNIALGDKRANAAREFLISQGVDPARIDTVSFGEEKPIATGHDEESWRQNRRAHLVMR